MPDGSEKVSHKTIDLWDLTDRVCVASCTSCAGELCYVLKCDETFVTPMGKVAQCLPVRWFFKMEGLLQKVCRWAMLASAMLFFQKMKHFL